MNGQRVGATAVIIFSFFFPVACTIDEVVEPTYEPCPCTIGEVYTCHCPGKDGEDPRRQTGLMMCDRHNQVTSCYCGDALPAGWGNYPPAGSDPRIADVEAAWQP